MKHPQALLLLTLALAACSPAPTTPPPPADGTAADAGPATPAMANSATDDAAATLPRYHWRLVEANDADGTRIDALFANAGKPLQLDFLDGRVSVSNACNRMGGGYAFDGGRLEVGQLAGTLMACPDDALMAMEREAGRRLGGTHAATLDARDGEAPRLSLAGAGGDVLVFQGAPTAATRYGGEGERVFLEVAPRRVTCSHPLIPDHQCLRVREIGYGADGVKTTTGEWQPLYEEIEGYEHQPGVRNVLRLQRFQRRDVPADASSIAYVLDMVVESETVAE